MDPITAAILTAISAAASDVVKSSVKDAYEGLKAVIARKWGQTSGVAKAVTALEADPESQGQAAVLAEKVKAARATEDADVMQAVQTLVAELKKAKIDGAGVTLNVSTGAGSTTGIAGVQNAWIHTMNISSPKQETSEHFEAEVSYCSRKLKLWPHGEVPVPDLANRLERLSRELDDGKGDAIPKRALSEFYRCRGALHLIAGSGPPDNIRQALPYLDESLSFDPRQPLLIQNIEFLDQMLKQGKADITGYLTTIFQVLRGANDPDIAGLVSELRAAAPQG